MIGGLSSDDRPVRVGFISIAGQKREDFVVAAVAAHAQPSPSIVSLLIYDESQTKIAISDIVPVAEAPLRRVGRDHHLVAHGEERRSRPHANSRRKSVRPVVSLLCLHCIFASSGDHEQESLRTSFKSVGVILQDEIGDAIVIEVEIVSSVRPNDLMRGGVNNLTPTGLGTRKQSKPSHFGGDCVHADVPINGIRKCDGLSRPGKAFHGTSLEGIRLSSASDRESTMLFDSVDVPSE